MIQQQLSCRDYLHLAFRPDMSLCINFYPLRKEASLTKIEKHLFRRQYDNMPI